VTTFALLNLSTSRLNYDEETQHKE